MECVYFSLGSNLGNRGAHIAAALAELERLLRNFRVSRVYETEPLYYRRQPGFLNAVCSGYTASSAEILLRRIQRLEHTLGRRRRNVPRFGPRSIDIDLLLYGKHLVTGPRLIVPHPRMQERKFVLIPLIELAPYLTDPRTGILFWKYLLKIEGQAVYFHSFSRYTLAERK
ncbi:MAG: 2-amino-4-hydroxy-6-hydroxymethyldihydropteridine diphosphokinase [Spirochaetia bacterium]|jgi:2-amino-4-hydroxy-6-hydroxymethyldihydropteridine diphosphokinase